MTNVTEVKIGYDHATDVWPICLLSDTDETIVGEVEPTNVEKFLATHFKHVDIDTLIKLYKVKVYNFTDAGWVRSQGDDKSNTLVWLVSNGQGYYHNSPLFAQLVIAVATCIHPMVRVHQLDADKTLADLAQEKDFK